MIDLKGKGGAASLFVAISDAGHSCIVRGTQLQVDDEMAVQAIIDSFPLSTAQAEIVAQIDAYAKSLRDSVVANISSAEMAAWSIKQSEALAYQASSNAADAPMLGIEATARGIPLAALAAKVMEKAVQLSQFEAMIAGVAGAHSDAVKATTTFADALAYDWHIGWPI